MSSDKQPNEKSPLEPDDSTLTSSTAITNGERTGDPGPVGEEEANELREKDVEELLRRIDTANGIADGVEGKLDGILEHLDVLLKALGEEKENGGPTNPQPDR